MKKLYIAEKPELARAIGEGLKGVYTSKDGYFEKGENLVSWSFGHILEIKKPDEMNPNLAKWSFETLPFTFAKFERQPQEKAKKQLNLLVELINSKEVSEIVHCGDADDEGQILIDEILEFANNKKPVSRVLINDLTKSAVEKAIANARPNSEFKGMSERGFARSEADYLVGMNLSRAYTLRYREHGGTSLLSVGRVQTPILGLVVARDEQFNAHKSTNYYIVAGKFDVGGEVRATLKTEDKILDENVAKNIAEVCTGKTANLNAKLETKQTPPPLPYSLLSLQKECALKFGLKPDAVLKITQKLREEYRAITYNRSDCEYLPTTIWQDRNALFDAIASNLSLGKFIDGFDENMKSRAFDDSAITAHYAIIPTSTKFKFSELKETEKAVYRLIAERFLLQFYEPFKFQSFNIKFAIGEYEFATTLSKPISQGWKVFYDDGEVVEKSTLDFEKIANLVSGECKAVEISKEKTKPLPLYTMATLLGDLNGVAKYVKDEKIKKLLLEKDSGKKGERGGIGTPATRSAMIEVLIDRGYISVSNDKKQVVQSTELGRNLISACSGLLSRVDMTALWYELQQDVESGAMTRQEFLTSVFETINTEIENLKTKKITVAENDKREKNMAEILGNCPKCKEGEVVEKKSVFGCSKANFTKLDSGKFENSGCDYQIWKNALERFGKKDVTKDEVKKLLRDAKFVAKLKSKAGKDYTADVVIDLKYGLKVEFKNNQE